MDDEEAKRIQEERDKQLTEEYQKRNDPQEPVYNERGNIPGPGPSRVGTIPKPQLDKVAKEHNPEWPSKFATWGLEQSLSLLGKQGNYNIPASKQTVDVNYESIIDGVLNRTIPRPEITQGLGRYDPKVYIPPNELIGTQKGEPLQAKFEYQGNFMFDRDGRVHLNKINPTDKVAWDYWLHLTAKKSGYESMKEMVKVMREWPEEQFQEHMTELWHGSTEDGTPTNPFHYIGYSEHKKAKASKKDRLAKIQRSNPDWNQTQISEDLVKKSSETYDMDWLHDTEWIDHTGTLRTDGIGLGDRNAPKNMLALFNSRWKSIKDVAEGVGYGGELSPGPLFSFSDGTWRNPNQRFYIDVEDPGKKTKQYLRHNPGDIVIKRASNHKIIGNLGSYLDALYPKDESLKTRLQIAVPKTINPSTGKFFSDLIEFRRHVILERINIILRDTNTLPSNATKRKRYIKEKIQEDMDRLFAQYPFLKPTKVLSDEIAADADLSEEGYIKRGQGKREGIPPLGSKPVRKGPFKDLTKTLEQETTKIKGTGRVPTEDEYKKWIEEGYGPD